jgi:hypothetical protein
MIKIIKLIPASMEPTMRTGGQKRSSAVWGVQINGEVIAMIYSHNSEYFIREYAVSGRMLHHIHWGPNRFQKAKEWALQHYAHAC